MKANRRGSTDWAFMCPEEKLYKVIQDALPDPIPIHNVVRDAVAEEVYDRIDLRCSYKDIGGFEGWLEDLVTQILAALEVPEEDDHK